MNQNSETILSYSVAGVSFDLETAISLYKSRYKSIDEFRQEVIAHPMLEKFDILVSSLWDYVSPMSPAKALSLPNLEQRRTAFSYIGVSNLFKNLNAEKIASETVVKVNHRWDQENIAYEQWIFDTYELYRIPSKKLFDQVDRRVFNLDDVYAVRCWCTSSEREYFIYVPPQIGERRDPIAAVAWTIWIGITDPARIYRQGDIIIAELSENSTICDPYHLTREQYLNLMYAET